MAVEERASDRQRLIRGDMKALVPNINTFFKPSHFYKESNN